MTYSENLRRSRLDTLAISRMMCEIGSRIKDIQDFHTIQLHKIKRLEDDLAILNSLLKQSDQEGYNANS